MGNMHDIYRRYCECLVSVDEQVGRLIDVLEQKGILDDTLIVYAGDNGYIWGEHRLYAKHHPYEESIRIPYIVRPPRGYAINKGARPGQMVLNIDLAPTLLDIAGIPIPGEMQGESFLPIMRSTNAPGRESWVYELFRDFPFGGRVPPNKTLRTNRYKYIDWELCKPDEIYDLHEDPREKHNLYGTDKGKKLAKALTAELELLKKQYHIIGG
jgi:arylsulfatase A-like enzyme